MRFAQASPCPSCSLRECLIGALLFLGAFHYASGAYAECRQADYIITGANFDEVLGFSVSGGCDVNGDGLDDIIAGAWTKRIVYVFSVVGGDTIMVVNSPAERDNFGLSVSCIGDINGNNKDEFIVGAGGAITGPFGCWDTAKGYVFAVDSRTPLYVFSDKLTCGFFPFSASGAGDYNADGFADILVGLPRFYIESPPSEGFALVVSGATGDTLQQFVGEGGPIIVNEFGSAVSGAGDVNADGYDDVLIGAFRHSTAGFEAGRAYVFSGFDGDTLYVFTGEGAGDYFGKFLSGGMDANNDGYDDFVIAGGGKTKMFSGIDGSIIFTLPIAGTVSFAGDFNDDGFADILVGEYLNDEAFVDAGKVTVASGADGSILSVYYGEATADRLGKSVSNAGDVNGDGIADIVIGADGHDSGAPDGGRIYVYLGSPQTYECGDVNNDCETDMDDVLSLVDFYFHLTPTPPVPLSADVNCDGAIDLLDIVYLTYFINGTIPELCCANSPKRPDRPQLYYPESKGE